MGGGVDGGPTVWVVQDAGDKDIVPAERYGRLQTLMSSRSQIYRDSRGAVAWIERKLRDFSDDDYLLALGDPIAIGIACAVAAAVNQGRFKVLKWSRNEQDYYPIQVSLS